jgi:GT2 family glycosyltransferase
VLPANYLNEVSKALTLDYVDCYGGPDAADDNFSNLQKAINYSMTSFLTTGGIRGSSENLGKFQPRSFNMGLSRAAFLRSGGFGNIHPGEDPDLTIRLWKMGYETRLFKKAYVYHKRRISFRLFYKQVNKFGKVRVILNKWHPQSAKPTYWFPTIFSLLLVLSIIASIAGSYWILSGLIIYLLSIGIHCTFKNSIKVGAMAIIATILQFLGYGLGFIYAYWVINIAGKDERTYFKQLFFK